ncbi:MAG TPA: trypsin-like peptidase domain-containing protein [Candidatus Limnocylindrales bacterium]|jgi:serine protease Do|nr:trypsin-like peptidase domain-containing protein [Candidatus Limnocylindrales bacterium]
MQKTWLSNNWKKGKTFVAVLALTLAVSLGGYELVRPEAARAANIAPAASALDDNSVSALTSLDKAMETLAARVTPAVVNVTVVSRNRGAQMRGRQQMQDQGQGDDQDQNDMQRFFGQFGFGPQMRQGPQIEHGLGSGIIISPDGYIVTNNHVVEGAVDLRVTLNDRRVLPAKLIGADPLTDLAVIKVNANNLQSVPWGESSALKPGQSVLAFGNPFGFRFTVTRGIVSALNRTNPYTDDPRKPGQFIQTDAAINPGNSGGPLVNAHGEVVGINTFLISPSGSFSGMGFAIPAQLARPIVNTLIKDGKVEHARIGVSINDVTPENATFFHLNEATGALVSQVEPDSPGAKAGLKVGDVITELNGKKVDDAGQLQALISQEKPGDKVNLAVFRDGKNQTMPVTLEAMNPKNTMASNSGNSQGKPRWGVGLSDLTPDVRDELQLPTNVKGAVVTNVQPGSPADNAGISRGDVIVEVDRHQVQSSQDVKRELGSVPTGKDALLLVWSNGGSSFRVMHAAEAAQPAGE